jgi:hypothetical protein
MSLHFLRFSHQTHVRTASFPIRAAYSTYLILLDLITRIIFGNEYTLLSVSLCSPVHSPLNSSLLEPSKWLRC